MALFSAFCSSPYFATLLRISASGALQASSKGVGTLQFDDFLSIYLGSLHFASMTITSASLRTDIG